MADVQIAVIDPEDTQLALAAPAEAVVNVAVPGVQGPIGLTGSVTIAQAGTAAEPGIRFESDTNTGIYSPGADQLAVSTGGTGRLFVASDGKVGIGTSSPSYPLDVRAANAGSTTYISVDNTSTTSTSLAGIYFSSNGTPKHSITAATFGADFMAFNVGSAGVITERARITSAGNVGIGTTSPDHRLDVRGTGTTTAQVGTLDTSGTAVGQLRVFYAGGGGGFASACYLRAGSAYTYLASESNSPLLLGTNNTERARIDSSGRLLVGASTSRSVGSTTSGLFQVEQTSAAVSQSIVCNVNAATGGVIALGKSRGTTAGSFTVVQDSDELGSIRFAGADGTDLETQGARIDCFVDGTPGANDMPGRLVFSTTADGAATPTERFRITSAGVLQVADAGNITVGTTTGTKIGTGTTQKLGFYNATPVVQPTAVADATDAATVITQLNALLTRMRNLGLIAT